jgi:rhamnosyltransferase
VTVVFLTRNSGPEFKKTLAAVLAQETPWNFEILVLDNESTDGTWELVQRRQSIRSIRVPREEFRHGPVRNKAFGLAKGEIMVNLVGDAMPVGKRWLATLVAPLIGRGKGTVAGVSGRQVPPKGLPVSQEFFLLKSYPEEPRVLDGVQKEFGPGKIWFSNVCSAIPRWAWEEVKFPDVIMSEDQGWATEILRRGWKLIYEPRAAVIHGHKLNYWWLIKRNSDSGASLANIGAVVKSVGSGEMWKYLVEEITYAAKTRGLGAVLSVFPYEAVRWIGFQIGYRKFVPRRIKKFLSIVPWWWDNNAKMSVDHRL